MNNLHHFNQKKWRFSLTTGVRSRAGSRTRRKWLIYLTLLSIRLSSKVIACFLFRFSFLYTVLNMPLNLFEASWLVCSLQWTQPLPSALLKFRHELFTLIDYTSNWICNNSDSKKYRNQNCFNECINDSLRVICQRWIILMKTIYFQEKGNAPWR